MTAVRHHCEKPDGLAITEEMDGCYEKEVHHGQLYPYLDTLVEEGKQGRRTDSYAATPGGERESEARRD